MDAGITLYDTADVYGLGHAEKLLGRAIRSFEKKSENLVISTKGGVAWDSLGRTRRDSSAKYLKQAVRDSLRRLKIEKISLYFLHWPDGVTPIEESLNALKELSLEGYIQTFGVSNLAPADLRLCGKFSIAAIQIKGNLLEPEELIKAKKIASKLGVPIISYSSLADGLLSGAISSNKKYSADDHRSRYPLFQGSAKKIVDKRVTLLKAIVKSIHKSPAQFALRWLLDTNLASGVLFGAKNPRQAAENLGAHGWKIPKKEILAGCGVVYRKSSKIYTNFYSSL